MKPDALALANYIVTLSKEAEKEIRPLKLMKLVYITHGYILALTNRSALNPNYDKVEAWKYGPVIPSVYHSFKRYGTDPVQEETVIFDHTDVYNFEVKKPRLVDSDFMAIAKFVYNSYSNYSDNELVALLHEEGTPWQYVYQEGKNKEIPDDVTRAYYARLVEHLLASAKKK